MTNEELRGLSPARSRVPNRRAEPLVPRLLRYVLALAVGLGGTPGFSSPASADGCGLETSTLIVAGSGTATATDGDRWHDPLVGPRYITLHADADGMLRVEDADCLNFFCWTGTGTSGFASCYVDSPTALNIVVYKFSSGPEMRYTVTSTPAPIPPTACGDRIDNDGDGRSDFPADSGCTSPDDTTEEPCMSAAGAVACAEMQPGLELHRVTVNAVGTTPAPGIAVVGSMDVYRFTLPNGGIVTIPCVSIGVGADRLTPCRTAGGVFVNTVATLLDTTVNPPTLAIEPPVASVGVCEATVVLTVNGIGVESFPAYTVC